MFIEERQIAIEKVLREQGKVRTRELSEMFQVTEDCIRKDLKTLENAGKLKRTYGGAILSQDYPLERDVIDRRNYHVDKKMVIAAKAMTLIMYPTVNGFLGSAAIQVIRQYSFDRAFMGSCGIDMMDHTVTTLGVEDGLTKKAAIESSRHKYAVMEREKFYFNESYKFTLLDSLGVTLY